MNRFKSMIFMIAVLVMSMSCEKDQQPAVQYLDITPNNISGVWKLVEWNGVSLNEETYFYIEFIRKDKEFIIYQNFDSMGDMPHVTTGEFNIIRDEAGLDIIRGNYDYSGGFWTHEYVVMGLTATDMTWTAEDDVNFIQKFVRVPVVPENIKGEF